MHFIIVNNVFVSEYYHILFRTQFNGLFYWLQQKVLRPLKYYMIYEFALACVTCIYNIILLLLLYHKLLNLMCINVYNIETDLLK